MFDKECEDVPMVENESIIVSTIDWDENDTPSLDLVYSSLLALQKSKCNNRFSGHSVTYFTNKDRVGVKILSFTKVKNEDNKR